MELPIFVYFGNTLARGVGSGLKNAQLVDCHSSSVPALDIQPPNPPQIFNEDQIVLQRAQLDPVFVANAREVMKSRHSRSHASLQQTFPRKVDQFLFGGRALITRVWNLKKTDFVQLNAPPIPIPAAAGPNASCGENRTFSRSALACASASLPPRSWSQYISTRSTSSCHICHKVSSALK